MALRCLWSFRRTSACRNGILFGTCEMRPSKVPLTEEEKRLLEKLGDPDSETRGYLNELYTGFGIAAEKKRGQRSQDKSDAKGENRSEKPAKTLPSSNTYFLRMFHTSAEASSFEKKIFPSSTNCRKAFKDESRIIWDAQEEPVLDCYAIEQKDPATEESVIARGETGVFDIDVLVKLLRQEKLQDIAVIQTPPDLAYADYLIIGTTLSKRQGVAITAFLKKMYKVIKRPKDRLLKIEGENCNEWKVLDFGNIVLHLFDAPTRERYDLETLWTVGREFDELTQNRSRGHETLDILGQHMAFVRSLSTPSNNKP